jgi:hypothetical protein
MAIAELSATANDTYIGGTFYMMWHLAGDAVHQCGYVVASHATEDLEMIVCGVGGIPACVTALQHDLDIDTEITDGVMYEYYLLHVGTALLLPHDTNADAAFAGEDMGRSETVAGMINAGPTIEDNELVGRLMKVYDAAADCWLEVIT